MEFLDKLKGSSMLILRVYMLFFCKVWRFFSSRNKLELALMMDFSDKRRIFGVSKFLRISNTNFSLTTADIAAIPNNPTVFLPLSFQLIIQLP